MLTQDYVKGRLSYDLKTGIFVWKNGRNKGKRAGTVNQNGYRLIFILNKRVREHRLAFLYVKGNMPEKNRDVDHINGNRSDNRWENLRTCTRSENLQNKRKNGYGTSKYRGVSFYKNRNKYEAYIDKNGKRKKLGYFDREIDAARAYDEAAKEMFGEFASPNLL